MSIFEEESYKINYIWLLERFFRRFAGDRVWSSRRELLPGRWELPDGQSGAVTLEVPHRRDRIALGDVQDVQEEYVRMEVALESAQAATVEPTPPLGMREPTPTEVVAQASRPWNSGSR